MLKKNIIFIFAVIVAVIFLSYLRMFPAIGNQVEFKFDRAFNYRMTGNVLEQGDVPELDRLSTYPQGKNIKAFLPTGLYQAAAFFHKIVNKFISIPLSRSILLFCSICGALIFLPIYFLSYEIYRNKSIAYITAVLAGIMPAYLHRTFCYWYRYEVLGTLLLFSSLLFFIKAQAGEKAGKKAWYITFSIIFLGLAMLAWRLSVLFIAPYAIFILYNCLKIAKPVKKWLASLGLLLVPFGFIAIFSGKHTLAGCADFPKAAFQILLHNIGVKQVFSDFARLVYYNRELHGVTLGEMFNPLYLSLSAIFVIVYFVSYLRNKSQPDKKNILFIFLVFYSVITFIFLRNKIILGPLAALSAGESLCLVLKNKKQKLWRNLLLCLIAAVFIKTGYDSCRLAATRQSGIKLNPYLKESLNYINQATPKDAVILSYWADGYPIQTYCNRPTITDGLLESREIVKRIMALSKIYYSNDENKLRNFCEKYGVTHILLPVNRRGVYAGYAGFDYDKYYPLGRPAPAAEPTLLYKLIYSPNELSNFHILYKNKEFSLFLVGNDGQ
ncbi:MAG: STT3 domain-containing protein [Candidatus Omnitrophota bacterium]